ncbi:MAG TPA: transporter substrate-binding domain-containing protein [Pseudonocardiaceae bacterium]
MRRVALLLTGLLVAGCGLSGGGPAPTTPAAPSVRNIGVGIDLPGFGLIDPATGVQSGFDIELAQWLGRNSDPPFTPVLVPVTIGARDDKIVSGETPIVVDVYSITDRRREKVGFAGPYLITEQGVLVRAGDTRIRTLADLSGKAVCTQNGSTSLEQLDQGSVAVTSDIGTMQCVERLLAGQVDAVSTDQLILHGFAQRNPALAVVDGLTFGSDERYGIGLPKGDVELCRRFTDLLRKFIVDGRWDEAFRANFGTRLTAAHYKPDPYSLDPCE